MRTTGVASELALAIVGLKRSRLLRPYASRRCAASRLLDRNDIPVEGPTTTFQAESDPQTCSSVLEAGTRFTRGSALTYSLLRRYNLIDNRPMCRGLGAGYCPRPGNDAAACDEAHGP
jgi:hypothetical protein